MLGMTVLSCQRKTCTYVPNLNLDSIPRNQFINAISSMYEDVGLTDHFPESWQKLLCVHNNVIATITLLVIPKIVSTIDVMRAS